MDESSDLPSDPEQLANIIEEAENKVVTLQAKIAEEESKMERYRVS